MKNYEAIEHAKRAADEQGYELSAFAYAHRFAIGPKRAFWRVSFGAGEDGPQGTVVLIDEETEKATVYHVWPWSAYDTVRVVAFPLILLFVLGFIATLVHRTIGFFFGNLRGSGMGAIIAGLVASTTFFAMPVLRFFGKDRWFLNRELREEIKRSEAVDTPEIQDADAPAEAETSGEPER